MPAMFRNRSASAHTFTMIPRAEVPRSSFRMPHSMKTAFDAGYLVPMYVEEIVPGDSFNVRMTAFCRLATPIFPIMDNLHLETFFFFVPNRLVWTNWQRFMGERDPDPDSSIDYLIPCLQFDQTFAVGSIFDYMGLPTAGQIAVNNGDERISALPFRAYNLIYNEWFRDQNLIDSIPKNMDDGPDDVADYVLRKRGKRHDYFTSCLTSPQKGEAATLPLGTIAPVRGIGYAEEPTFVDPPAVTSFGPGVGSENYTSGVNPLTATGGGAGVVYFQNPTAGGIYADLSQATAATINQLREAFQIQRLLERDARGGTRYTEIVRSHFGVLSPDARLQRPEYLGGGSTSININPVAQTSSTDVTTPQGNLAAFGTGLAGAHGFTKSFTEHGFVIGLMMVRADLNYQQGIRRMWSRSTRYDHYWPVFGHLGEQAVLSKEIFFAGNNTAADQSVFGYQERWGEMRTGHSMITGLMRSTAASNIDRWHLTQEFASRPTLVQSFIEESPPLERVLAVGSGAAGQQLLCDAFFDVVAARPMSVHSVPGMMDHF